MPPVPGAAASLEDWLAHIEQLHPANIEMGLDRVRKVYDRYLSASLADKVIVVAGTNGKGSTVSMLSALLSTCGLKVGAYTSPHIHRFNERMQVCGDEVDDKVLVTAFEQLESARGDIPLTYFEFTTLAAFKVFSESQLDFAVLEIGLGGRLDAVNVVENDLNLITSVDFDHQDWLGDTLDKIAFEKAGVMREGVTTLLAPGLPEVVDQHAKQLGANTLKYGDDFGYDAESQEFYFASSTGTHSISAPELPLPKSNQGLAIQAAACLLDVENKSILYKRFSESASDTLKAFSMPGRLQKVSVAGCDVLLDVGHNPQAAAFLAKYLKNIKSDDKEIVAVYSALEDKDIESVVDTLGPIVDEWYLCSLVAPRAAKIEKLQAIVGAHSQNMLSFHSVSQALETAIEHAKSSNSLVLCFGSFYVVEAATLYLQAK